MVRLWELTRYQKCIILVLLVLLIFFTVLYSVVTSRVGFLYMDKIFVPREENGTVTYSATVNRRDCTFTVTADKVVTFRYGDKVYGPYTAKEDPSAIPEDHSFADIMTGVEVREGGKIIFRGGVANFGADETSFSLFSEDGNNDIQIYITTAGGTIVDSHGNVVDQMKPAVGTVLKLMHGPELTRKGHWLAWFGGVFISILTAVSIFFEDELFRLHLSFRVYDPDAVEPSDWEITRRSIGYALCVVATLVLYIKGLQ